MEHREPPRLSSATRLPELPRLRGVISERRCFPWTAALLLGTPQGSDWPSLTLESDASLRLSGVRCCR